MYKSLYISTTVIYVTYKSMLTHVFQKRNVQKERKNI